MLFMCGVLGVRISLISFVVISLLRFSMRCVSDLFFLLFIPKYLVSYISFPIKGRLKKSLMLIWHAINLGVKYIFASSIG